MTATDLEPITDEQTDGQGLRIAVEEFDLARHNGEITISNPATGQHRTFRVRTCLGGDLEGKRVVELLTGSDNTDDYRGFGFVTESGRVAVWRKCRGASGKRSDFEVFADMLTRPAVWEHKGAVYQIAGRCRRCNRLLTHPESIADGMGPTCRGRD